MNHSSAFGEIIESSLTHWTIQTWQLDSYPPFGSIIKMSYDNCNHFGVISDINTGPKDSGRTPFSYKKTIQELKQEQPHIFQLLETRVTAIPLSYSDDQTYVYEIPKRPAPIHVFAQSCNTPELNAFFSNSRWMVSFFNLARLNPLFDELLIAILHNAHQHKVLNKDSIQEIIDIFSLLTHDDYRKLKIFLQRIEAFIY